MIKKIAWNTFKNTGDINTFLEYKQIENIQKNIEKIGQFSDKEEKIEKIGQFSDKEEKIEEINKFSDKDINIEKNKID